MDTSTGLPDTYGCTRIFMWRSVLVETGSRYSYRTRTRPSCNQRASPRENKANTKRSAPQIVKAGSFKIQIGFRILNNVVSLLQDIAWWLACAIEALCPTDDAVRDFGRSPAANDPLWTPRHDLRLLNSADTASSRAPSMKSCARCRCRRQETAP